MKPCSTVRASLTPAHRLGVRTLVLVALVLMTSLDALAQGGNVPPPQQRQRSQMGNNPNGGFAQRPPMPAAPQRGEHLSQWMRRRSELTLEQQQHALQLEPGFRQLPPEMQQRMMDRLQKLNQMPPDRRERLLQRNEAIERMTPQQRHNYYIATQAWHNMPPDRLRATAQAFNQLRRMPMEQRDAALNSPQFRSRLTDQERITMGILLSAEPVLPPAPPRLAPQP